MEFSVRKIMSSEDGSDSWVWKEASDFDRLDKFSDDEVFEDEVIFKLVKRRGGQEEQLDSRPQHLAEGYNCFSLYKHSDNSYEWRLCKVVGKELRPEFKTQAALESFLKQDANQSINKEVLGQGRVAMDESDEFLYFLEFLHLKDYGREMWCKRRREDVVFSAGFSREDKNFEKNCFKFILDSYKQ